MMAAARPILRARRSLWCGSQARWCGLLAVRFALGY